MATIAFLGNFAVPYSSENHHANTLESMGHSVIRLQEGRAASPKVYKAAMASSLFIWVHTHGWRTPETNLKMTHVLEELRAKNIPTITYHLDLWFGLKRQEDLETDTIYKDIEYFFTVDKLMADWFNENTRVKGRFIPAGVYGPECYIHKTYDGINFENDVIFVGSRRYHPEYPYRPQLIDFLRQTYGSRFKHVGGDGDTGVIRGDHLNRMYATSKVAIGDSLNLNFNYPYYSSDRLFESTGRGGFTIYPNIVGLDEYYKDKEEIVFYKHGDFNDLKTKIDYYLANNEEREAIRLAGHERAKADHTYTNRWTAILDEVGVR